MIPKDAPPEGQVSFCWAANKQEPVEEVYGTIDKLAELVHEMAAVDWDRFVSETGLEPDMQLRFVGLNGEWRAFCGKPQAFSGCGTFLAQWYPEEQRWRNVRTKAVSKTVLEKMLKEQGMDATISLVTVGAGQDDPRKVVGSEPTQAERRNAESELFIYRRRLGLCVRCGSEEGMLCACK